MDDVIIATKHFLKIIKKEDDIFFYSIEKDLANNLVAFLTSKKESYLKKEKIMNKILPEVISFVGEDIKKFDLHYKNENNNSKKILLTWFEDVISLKTKPFWFQYFKKNPCLFIDYSLKMNLNMFKINIFTHEELIKILKKLPDQSLESLESNVMYSAASFILKRGFAEILIDKAKDKTLLNMLEDLNYLSLIEPIESNYEYYPADVEENVVSKINRSIFLKNIYSSEKSFFHVVDEYPFKVVEEFGSYIIYLDINSLNDVTRFNLKTISEKLIERLDIKVFAGKIKRNDKFKNHTDFGLLNKETLPYCWSVEDPVEIKDLGKLFECLKTRKKSIERSFTWSRIKDFHRNLLCSFLSKNHSFQIKKEAETVNMLNAINYMTGYSQNFESKLLMNFDFVNFLNKYNDINVKTYPNLKEFIETYPDLVDKETRCLTEDGVNLFRLNYEH